MKIATFNVNDINKRLANLLRALGAAPVESSRWLPSRLADAALSDAGQAGSVLALSHNARAIALLLRDRLTRDSWRVLQRPLPRHCSSGLESAIAPGLRSRTSR